MDVKTKINTTPPLGKKKHGEQHRTGYVTFWTQCMYLDSLIKYSLAFPYLADE